MLLIIFINFTHIYHKLQKELILNDNNWIIYTYYDYKNKLYNFVTHMKKFYITIFINFTFNYNKLQKNLISNNKSSIIYNY